MKKTILSEEDPAKEIGKTLKKIRFDRELTLDNVSMMTGVSKTMLGQIERGTSVPTYRSYGKSQRDSKYRYLHY